MQYRIPSIAYQIIEVGINFYTIYGHFTIEHEEEQVKCRQKEYLVQHITKKFQNNQRTRQFIDLLFINKSYTPANFELTAMSMIIMRIIINIPIIMYNASTNYDDYAPSK